MSSLPASIAEDRSFATASHDEEPLFSVTVHDIDGLQARKDLQSSGWIACSSDQLLATKNQLFDIKVEFPPASDIQPLQRWPTVTTSGGVVIKATQRDLRHYRALRTHITTLYEPNASSTSLADNDDDEAIDTSTNEESRLLAEDQDDVGNTDPAVYPIEDEASVAEPTPWAAIAYDSFIWWASAGERDADFQEERDFDEILLDAAFAYRSQSPTQRRRSISMTSRAEVGESFETSVVAYFQRLTEIMLLRLLEVVPATDDNNDTPNGREVDEEVEDEYKGFVTKEDLIKMGLDVWSKSDRTFVHELAKTYLGAEVDVQGKSVDCCGVRIL